MGENHGERNFTMSMVITGGFSGELGFLDSDLLSHWKSFNIYTSHITWIRLRTPA